ncbi:glycosyltransferase family 2 protein [Bacillus sp. HNR-4]|uniref:glycosyltransferase family 2 protein n=1 Tax=Bacillus sp. HNR-4 TaxID=2796141 RepID=UPI002378D59F|nr:glycosyltransferase family 2 protein [Bacillus sp. HNR-4]WDL92124.1 glycosyltransferase family 2 protein [Bacillus sp. HNR-4]
MENRKFSVLIPVYNVEKFIAKCIESVLNQTYQNFEVILINDGSTDSSGIVCEEYAKKDNRLKLYHQNNQGLMTSRQNAISKASGDFCLFLDSDDYWDTELLEKINRTIHEYNCDLVIFKYKRVSEKGEFISEAPSIFKDETVFDNRNKEKLFKNIINSSNLNNLVCKAVKRNLLNNIDYSQHYGVKNGEDLLQSLPLLYKSEKTLYINSALYNYRTVLSSMTNTLNVNFLKDITVVRGSLLYYLKQLGMDTEDNLKEFYQFYMRLVLNYIFELMNSDIPKKDKITIISKFQQEQLYKETIEKVKVSGFSLEKQILFYLISKNYYKAIFIYAKVINSLKKIIKYFA